MQNYTDAGCFCFISITVPICNTACNVAKTRVIWLHRVNAVLNCLTPNDPYSGHTTPLTSKVAFYIFIQQI